ncbi:MAG: NAD(P)/FAD-dependent oxidoreductase [Faecalibacterium sp.]
MILVRDLRLPLSAGEQQAFDKALRTARIPRAKVERLGVARLSVDARHGQPKLVYTVAATLRDEREEAAYAGVSPAVSIRARTDFSVHNGTEPLAHRPIVCGLGPAGLFAALLLARQGYRPIVLERGPELAQRVQAVELFSSTGELDENANIQFGEGGAGTFSDGKLTTRIGDALCGFVTQVFLEHGAPPEIAWQQKPHVGTDLLRGIIVSIRQEIEALGGEVHFNTALTGFVQKDGRLTGVRTTGGELPCQALVFAVGHSARDTFSMLMDSGLALECKPFSVGFRAEHLQSEIEKSLYHEAAGHPALPRGEYQLSQHVGQRCVYTFCMCPGGQVVASASEQGRVVTNGMSYHARDGKNANAAVVVSVSGEDFAQDPRRAIAFQRELEARAYAAGQTGGLYAAPAENIQSFLEGRGTLKIGRVEPTYDRGVVAADLGALLPEELSRTLRAGLRAYERKIAGYTAPEAVLTGLETRTSSPVRLVRGEELECTQLEGLYPCGEGAGYAGGIMSAAVDGLRVARAIISRYCPAEG